jgi:hypothetical protein
VPATEATRAAPTAIDGSLPPELTDDLPNLYRRDGILFRIPEPWHGRLTARRFRRWLNASRAAARHNARLPADAPVLNFYPMRPQPTAPISAILRRLGVRIAYSPRPDQPTIAWDGDTWFSKRAAARLPPNAINGRALDISKTVVDDAWRAVGGRSLAIDPRATSGPIVMKPEDNGRHGGRIIEGPVANPRRGWVYQRLLESREGEWVTQTRAVVIKGELVLAYKKWRRYPDRFQGTRLTVVREPSELYSDEEQALLLAFCARMGLDYAELDVVRDDASAEIYVVDANRTSSSPHALAVAARGAAYDRMAQAFRPLLGL